jgi:hypothetical protein
MNDKLFIEFMRRISGGNLMYAKICEICQEKFFVFECSSNKCQNCKKMPHLLHRKYTSKLKNMK